VEAPDLATVKDFLRFCAAKGKGKIVEQITCDSLNSVAGWLFGGFTRVTDNRDEQGRQNGSLSCKHIPPSIVVGPIGH